MKTLMFAILSVTTATLFGAISDPEPDVTPASAITWEDFGGATRATSANWDAKDQTYSYSNGAFNMNNVSWQKGLTLNVGADMTFTANGAWHGPTGGTRELHVIRIFDGGTFNVNGDWDPNYTHLQVDNGGVFHFNPKSFKSDSNQSKQSWFDVYGTLDAPAGLKASGNLRMDIITHEGSTIQLGGDVSKNGNGSATLRWLVKGGQIKAVGDVHLDCAELEVAAGAAVSVDVAEDKVFDLYPFTTIGADAQIAKTGLGSIAVQSGAPVTVQEGVLLLPTAGEYDLSSATFSEGAMLKLGVAGVSVTACDASLLGTKTLLLAPALVADGVKAVTGPDAAFAEWAAMAINAAIGDEFKAVADGTSVKIQATIVKDVAIWTGAGADENWSTSANWESGVVKNGDNLEFSGTMRLANSNDLGNLKVLDVKFTETAGAFVLSGEGTLTVEGVIVNDSSAAQTVNLPIALAKTTLAVTTTGDVALAGGVTAGQPDSKLVKSGEGVLSVNAPGEDLGLDLQSGAVKVTGVEAGAAAFSSANDAVKVNGVLDVGGASVVIADTDAKGIIAGSTLKNGTFAYSRPDKQVGDQYLPWNEGSVTIDHANFTAPKLFSAGGTHQDSVAPRELVLDNGTTATITSSPAYITSRDNGDGLNDAGQEDQTTPVTVRVLNGSVLKLPETTWLANYTSGSARSGRLIVSNDSAVCGKYLEIDHRAGRGWLTVTDSTLDFTRIRMSPNSNDYNADYVTLTRSTVTNGSFIIKAKETKREYVYFDDTRMVAREDSAEFISKPTDMPYGHLEILAGGLTIDSNGHDIGISATTDLFGAGGLVKTGAGTLTLASANAYTGATVVEEGKMVISGRVAGSVIVAKDAELEYAAPPMIASLTLTEDAKLTINGLGSTISAVTGYSGADVTIKAETWTMATPIVTSPNEEFLTWLVDSLNEKGLLPEDREFIIKDGSMQVAEKGAQQKTAIWTGKGENANWSTAENWENGVVRNGDNLVLDGDKQTENVNDLGELAVLDVTFPASAGAFAVAGEGTLTVVGGITNLSENAQALNIPVSIPQLAFDILSVGDLTLGAGLSAVQEGTKLTKWGAGTLTINRPDGKEALNLAEGAVVVTGVTAPEQAFSSANDAVKVNGVLDVGGASVVIADTDARGIIAGSTLRNGTFAYSRPDKQVGDQYLPWNEGSVTIDHANFTAPKLFSAGGTHQDSVAPRELVLDNGTTATITSSPAYITSRDNGDGLNDAGQEDQTTPVTVRVLNGSVLKLPETTWLANYTSGSARNGRLVVSNDSVVCGTYLEIDNRAGRGWLTVTDSVLDFTRIRMSPNSNDYNADYVTLTRSTVTNGSFVVKAKETKREYVYFDDARLVARADSTEFINKPSDMPYGHLEVLAGGLTIDSNGHDIGISATTDLFGAGGLVKTGEGTLTLASANAYTGATVVEEGVLKLTGSVAGPLTIGANGTLAVSVADGAAVVGGAASLTFAEGAKVTFDATGLDPKAHHPFLLLPKDAAVSGMPTVEVTGAGKQVWRVVSKNTQDGVLCSVAPQNGFVITIF